jgi:hypothetical protein
VESVTANGPPPDDAVSDDGVTVYVHGCVPPTVITCSFEGALVPQALLLRTRTKYVPTGASTDNSVAALPVDAL